MSWSHVRGHDGPRELLRGAFAAGRLAHAYLFVGADGVGKRRFAGEFAKALLCERPPGPLEACDACPACRQVAVGSHPDLLVARKEEDRNEFRIAVMREFLAKLGLRPSRGLRKVGLVEDADEFNEEAANAFLKPLEEPPAGTTLVLLSATTDLWPTILSRCQVVPFRPLPAKEFGAVLAQSGVTDDATAGRLFRLSGGSPGRGLQLNDPSLWEFRVELRRGLTAALPDPVGLARKWVEFAEEAGKQAPAQRERVRLSLVFLLELLRDALRLSLAPELPADAEARSLAEWGRAMGADAVADRADAVLAAEGQIDRYVQLGLVLEALAGKLAKPAPPPDPIEVEAPAPAQQSWRVIPAATAPPPAPPARVIPRSRPVPGNSLEDKMRERAEGKKRRDLD